MSDPYSIVKPIGFTVASCGYCGGENSAKVYGAFAYRLASNDFQDLVDRGWRRFGLYLYRPNARDSCCRQYTIRLNSSEFTPSKGQRRTVARLNRYIKNQYVPLKISRESMAREDPTQVDEHSPSPEPRHGARRKSNSPPFVKIDNPHTDFIQTIHAAEMDKNTMGAEWKRFKVTLEPATFTQEKYDLYCEYQRGIHQVAPSLISREAFDSSITRTPLSIEPTLSTDEERSGFVGYGTYHHCYYIDDKLVAVAVIDILPRCLSSDYFYYDPSLSCLSLGKYSTLREIALVQEIKAIPGFEAMEHYTMGHYVQSAPKTHYKATYHPSFLLDPEMDGWYPIEKCMHLLQAKKYYSLSQSDLFDPRIKGLLITMQAEKRIRAKAKVPQGSISLDVESLRVREQGSSGSEDEGHKRKRSEDTSDLFGMSISNDLTRREKRPSLTSLPLGLDASSTMASPPPPGMLNPDEITYQQLSQIVVFQGNKAMMFTDSDKFKYDDSSVRAMQDYYAAMGPLLAPRMLVFSQ